MMGIDLEVGQHILHFRSGPGGIVHEDAKVILIRDNSIRVEFLGNYNGRKTKGDQSNLFNISGKVFVLNKDIEVERMAFQSEINDLRVKIVRLREEKQKLIEEVEKIHCRFDIIDL